jgi:transcriptional regulator of arginine metabolism
VTGIDGNETCVVVRTLTGRAQGVAVWIDSLGDSDILATVAGDDTILIVPRSTKSTSRLRAALSSTLGFASRPQTHRKETIK